MNRNYCELRLAAKGENVGIVRLVITDMLKESELLLSELDEIKVAVSEAVSNAIIHGYDNDESSLVLLCYHIENDYLTVKVQDWGRGIDDIKRVMEPEYSRIADRMGLGFYFMQSFMDRVEVQSELGKGTLVSMGRSIAAKHNKEAI